VCLHDIREALNVLGAPLHHGGEVARLRLIEVRDLGGDHQHRAVRPVLLEGEPTGHVHVGVVDARRHRPLRLPLHDLHLPLDGLAPAHVPPTDPRAEPDRSFRDLLHLHVGVPARMVPDVLDGAPPPNLGHRPVDRGRNLDPHNATSPQSLGRAAQEALDDDRATRIRDRFGEYDGIFADH
jgi:hypothetical protein